MYKFTAVYTPIESGYMGQLAEWPEVITEGASLDDCRAMLADALKEIMLAYEQLNKEIPSGERVVEELAVEP